VSDPVEAAATDNATLALPASQRPDHSPQDLFRLLRYARPYSPALLASVFFMAIVGLSQGVLVTLIKVIFDRVLERDSPTGPVLLYEIPVVHWKIFLNNLMPAGVHNVWTMAAFAILACFLAKGICDYLGNYLVNWVGLSAVVDLRQEVFDHVLRQDAHFFENQSTGQIMSSIMNDIDKIQLSVSSMLADWLRQIFTALFLVIAMVGIDWRLSAVSVTVLPFVLLPTMRLGRRIRRTTRKAQDFAGKLNQILQETITGHQVVKSFGAEDFESNRFRVAAQNLKAGNLKFVAQQSIASPIIEFFGALTIVGLLTYARLQVKTSSMTPGTFSSFVVSLLLLYEPVKRLTGIHNIFQQGRGAAEQVFRYLDRKQGVAESASPVRFAKFERNIQFDNVSFAYPVNQERIVLHDINLEIKVGEVVALVGPSGSGKSSMANLLQRLYDVSAGGIRIDSKDLRDVKLNALRDKIAMVAQDTFLFDDTVFNNIAYGRSLAKEEDVLKAAEAALADEFIRHLPEGYQTRIGERGQRLSGGQRQRISIARALLKNAPILILDEATSQLDTESEIWVQRALSVLMERRTVLVIAHRLSTIRRANKIVVMDSGRIVETGTHESLLAKGGVYHRLHELQHADTRQAVAE
jgi:ATP-binding cassette, subfamily B, bacterial MsbA